MRDEFDIDITLDDLEVDMTNSEKEEELTFDQIIRKRIWIPVPTYDKNGRTGFYNREIADITSEEFGAWIKWVYPSCVAEGNQYHLRMEFWDTLKKKKEIFDGIVSVLQRFKMRDLAKENDFDTTF